VFFREEVSGKRAYDRGRLYAVAVWVIRPVFLKLERIATK
jgi:hypothetical protein